MAVFDTATGWFEISQIKILDLDEVKVENKEQIYKYYAREIQP